MPDRPSRKSLRLPVFDYREHGAYFFTTVTRERRPLFGTVRDDRVNLNPVGKIVHTVWSGLSSRFPTARLDSFVVMPDHVHGIVFLNHAGLLASKTPTPPSPSTLPSLSQVIGALKSLSAREVNLTLRRSGPLWQRNYYERVIRDDSDLEQLRRYIDENPLRWTIHHDH